MYINRHPLRTENDDFKINVQPRLGLGDEVLEILHEGHLVAWKIVSKYE